MGLGWYLYYKGKYYDAGTKVKIKNKWGEIETATFLGGGRYEPYVHYFSLNAPESYIVEIIKPVYYQEPEQQKPKPFSLPAGDGPFYALLWYIAVMVVGTIFKDRLLIWVVATWIFFSYIKKK